MRLTRMVVDEDRKLEQHWPDDAGRDYRNLYLRPIENSGEDLRRILRQFEDALPRKPQRW